MSGFFESEVVRNAIKEMEELQQEIIESHILSTINDTRTKTGTC